MRGGKSYSTRVRIPAPELIFLADYFLRGGMDSFPGPGVLSNSGAAIRASFHSCLLWWGRKEKQEKNLLYDIYLHILYIWRDREVLIDSDSDTEIQTAAPGTTNLFPRVTKTLSGVSQLLKVRLVAVPAGRFGPLRVGDSDFLTSGIPPQPQARASHHPDGIRTTAFGGGWPRAPEMPAGSGLLSSTVSIQQDSEGGGEPSVAARDPSALRDWN